MTRNAHQPETIAADLRLLAIGLSAAGNLSAARLCRRAATELTLKTSEDRLRQAQAERAGAERRLIDSTAAAIRSAAAPGYSSRRPA